MKKNKVLEESTAELLANIIGIVVAAGGDDETLHNHLMTRIVQRSKADSDNLPMLFARLDVLLTVRRDLEGATKLLVYTDPKHLRDDAACDRMVRALRPDWFEDGDKKD